MRGYSFEYPLPKSVAINLALSSLSTPASYQLTSDPKRTPPIHGVSL